MASWATRRQLAYLFSAIAFLIVIFSYPLYKIFYTAPSCTDGIKNQDETGVDCGGSCEAVCPSDTAPLAILWSQELEVRPGLYDVVAHIENPNPHASVRSMPYSFKLYDENGILVAERRGDTYINPNEQFDIFEGAIDTGKRIPSRVFFEFASTPGWVKMGTLPPVFSVQNQALSSLGEKPRLKAELSNISLFMLRDIAITALIFDQSDNVLAASETRVDALAPGESKQISFIWPQPLRSEPARITVTPRINAATIEEGN